MLVLLHRMRTLVAAPLALGPLVFMGSCSERVDRANQDETAGRALAVSRPPAFDTAHVAVRAQVVAFDSTHGRLRSLVVDGVSPPFSGVTELVVSVMSLDEAGALTDVRIGQCVLLFLAPAIQDSNPPQGTARRIEAC